MAETDKNFKFQIKNFVPSGHLPQGDKLKIRGFCRFILDILFPPQCVSCGKKFETHTERVICEQCFALIPTRSGFMCLICGRRVPQFGEVCHREACFILAAATDYKNPQARETLHALKYGHIRSAAEPISEILAYYVAELILHHGLPTENTIIVPIPIHKSRLRTRGYNQSLLISELLQLKLRNELRVAPDALMRVRPTKSQTELKNYDEREKNVSGSFTVRNAESIAGKTVLLFDDVYTSGATMREAARELKRARARRVVGLVFAKA